MNFREFKSKKLTFRYHETLNPKFWDNFSLKREVKMQLIKIANTWAEFAEIPKTAIKDILLVGGNANYNYTDFSDLDLHLVVDKDKLPECPDLLDDFLRDKKQLWSLTHDIKIYNHDVELYAEYENTKRPSGQGVYSLKHGWLKKPQKLETTPDLDLLKRKTRAMMEKIDCLISGKSDDLSEIKKLKDKIKSMRDSSIRRGGEFALENLVFKELRNNGYLDKMNKYIVSVQDKKLSL
jgi:hypothetical protein